MVAYSLYLHIPFCRHRCAYCDFNTYAGQEELISAYVEALCREAIYAAENAPGRLPVHTIFFGGGTPSLLPISGLRAVLQTLGDHYDLLPEAEVSLEANPGTLSPEYLRELRQLGVNRLSLGMQSAHPDDLRLLERQHDFPDVIQAVKWARQAGFDNLNLDLIFGLSFQPLERWKSTLDLALGLGPEHLSLYALTLEHGTPFQHWAERGLIAEPDGDLAADMYDWAEERLEKAGYVHYEISNWARRSANGEALACRHNLQYWRNLPYLGLGAGAHGYAGGFRTANVLGIAPYIRRCAAPGTPEFPVTPATVNVTPVDSWVEMQETMMVGLRLTEEGVSDRRFAARFGKHLLDVFPGEIEELTGLGLLEWAGAEKEILRLTPRGHLLGNQVFMRFVGE